ncbi:Malectin [Operophtera brumata]|uniref:Malectin n=1 Tax=Operophtera brumata TaxID=104452 RepID=A0A0L7L2Z5_OPEBR|nr:Malectin [Operophtera brumata]
MLRSIIYTIISIISVIKTATGLGEIIYAVNAGGPEHTDIYGVHYESDLVQGRVGTASDYGKQLVMIGRVPPKDEILYQTERYYHSTFGYDIPAKSDGNYVLVLKFSEVYFNAPNMKVFDVVLNGDHTIVADLDIFDKVGRGAAHDEYIPYSIKKGKLYFNEEESDIRGGKIKVEFIKGYRDNPKINALYVMRGTIDEVPKLAPLVWSDSEPEEPRDEVEEASINSKRGSGPRTPDPYSMDESTLLIPVFVTIGAFIPLLFCLCKL